VEDLVERTVNYGTMRGCKYVEVRIHVANSTRIEVRNGKVLSATPGMDHGACVRVLIDDGWGFSSTTNVDPKSLKDSVDYAIKSALATGQDISESSLSKAPIVKREVILSENEKTTSTPIEGKIRVILEADKAARKVSRAIKTTLKYVDCYEEKYYGNSEGSRIKMEESWLYLRITAFASEAGVVQSYSDKFGVLGGFHKLRRFNYEEISEKVAEKALSLLKAEKTPAGKFTVVIDGDLAGLLAHEAFGHAAEADMVMEGTSVLKDKIGKRVASDRVTIVDDATLMNEFGSISYDDEGVKGQRKIIVQNGFLRGFLSNRESAFKLGIPLTGNARAQDYKHPPIVRMTNTFFEGGDMSLEELLEGVSYGIFAKGGRGGEVSPADGVFQFGAQEAYLIENGCISKPLRDFSMSGFILETLKNVTGVGRDIVLKPGFCGKMGQTVRVSSGGPYIRIEKMAVGGRRWI